MPEHSEPCYSHEVFVPRAIIFEICTVADHLRYWWPEGVDALAQSEALSRIVYTFPQSPGGIQADSEVVFTLHDLGATVRIDVYQSHLADMEATQQAAKQWQQRLAALENYLSSI
jgi:uncharacterized protein YndB with AHSA1/START domain